MDSRFYSDLVAEGQLAAFLDRHLYPVVAEDGLQARRVADKAHQRDGVDVILEGQGEPVFLDEKAQLYYINKPRETFAFEIEYTKDGGPRRGWFVNDRLKTQAYGLIWIHRAKTADLKKLQCEDLQKVECAFLSKAALRAWLEGQGIGTAEMIRTAYGMLQEKKDHVATKVEGVRFYRSPGSRYAEAPINLVIPKSYLLGLAWGHYMVEFPEEEPQGAKDSFTIPSRII